MKICQEPIEIQIVEPYFIFGIVILLRFIVIEFTESSEWNFNEDNYL